MAKGRPHSNHLRGVRDDVGRPPQRSGRLKSEDAFNAINFKEGIPKAPAFLTPKGRIAFDDFVEQLQDTGILSVVDGYSIGAACLAMADLLHADQELTDLASVTVNGPNGMQRNHPAYQRKSDADKRFRAWLCEFGMTPAARAKLGRKSKDEQSTEKDDEFFSDAA